MGIQIITVVLNFITLILNIYILVEILDFRKVMKESDSALNEANFLNEAVINLSAKGKRVHPEPTQNGIGLFLEDEDRTYMITDNVLIPDTKKDSNLWNKSMAELSEKMDEVLEALEKEKEKDKGEENDHAE